MSTKFETTILIRVQHEAEGGDGRKAWAEAGELRRAVEVVLAPMLEDHTEDRTAKAKIVEVDVTMPRKIEA